MIEKLNFGRENVNILLPFTNGFDRRHYVALLNL